MATVAPTDKVTGGIVMIISIGLISILAGISDNLGKVLLVFMFGILLIWLMTNYTSVQKWTGMAK